MLTISQLWNSNSEQDWKNALDNYDSKVQRKNIDLEHELEQLNLDQIKNLDQVGWYNFLHNKYFRWKYTDPRRYKQTTQNLEKYKVLNQLEDLYSIKQKLLHLDILDIKNSLSIAKEIYGLGIAGASGLITLMYPHAFGTVDKFVVDGLKEITDLPEYIEIKKIKADKEGNYSLSINHGFLLINIMRHKAKENNIKFNTVFWTPEK